MSAPARKAPSGLGVESFGKGGGGGRSKTRPRSLVSFEEELLTYYAGRDASVGFHAASCEPGIGAADVQAQASNAHETMLRLCLYLRPWAATPTMKRARVESALAQLPSETRAVLEAALLPRQWPRSPKLRSRSEDDAVDTMTILRDRLTREGGACLLSLAVTRPVLARAWRAHHLANVKAYVAQYEARAAWDADAKERTWRIRLSYGPQRPWLWPEEPPKVPLSIALPSAPDLVHWLEERATAPKSAKLLEAIFDDCERELSRAVEAYAAIRRPQAAIEKATEARLKDEHERKVCKRLDRITRGEEP